MTTITTLLQDTKYTKKAILEKLICHVLSLDKTQLFLDADHTIPEEKVERIHQAYTRYTQQQEPLEYIIGSVRFSGHDFRVTSATLIPRPETEYMIEAVKEWIDDHQKFLSSCGHSPPKGMQKKAYLLDLGTGCGVLGLSVLLHCKHQLIAAVCTDLSTDALHIAQENYLQHRDLIGDIPVEFFSADMLDHERIHALLTQPEAPLIIVANLPYIPEQLFKDNVDDRVKKREPKMAFVAGDDGLDLYHVMFAQLQSPLAPLTLFLEMMTRQVDILRQAYPERIFEEVKTFHFNIRIVRVCRV